MFGGLATRYRPHFFAFLLLIVASLALAQGTRRPKGDGDAGESDRPAERQRYFRRGRTAPGQSAAALRYHAYRDKLRRRAAARDASSSGKDLSSSNPAQSSFAGGRAWLPLGPAPIGLDSTSGQDYGVNSGRVTSIVVDQNDPTGNTVYAGAAYGGLWKSSNAANPDPAAVQWKPLLDDQPTLAVGAVALKPDDSKTILVGTGEANNSGDSYYGLGLLRSTDGGASWNLIASTADGTRSFQGMAFSKIAFSTDNPDLVVAATANSNAGSLGIDTSNLRGIYYSADAGASWQYASVQDNGITITPASTTSVIYHPGWHRFFAAVRFHGFYSSIDGAHWTRLSSQPDPGLSSAACPANVSFACPILRGEIAIQPVTGAMYAWFIDGGNHDRGVFATSDGASWTSLGVAAIDNCGDPQGCGVTAQGDYDLDLAAVPDGTGTDLYAGAINIYKCSLAQGGAACSTWLNLTHVYGCTVWGQPAHVHPDQHSVDFSRANPNLVYFGHDGGVSRALNGPGLLGGACTSRNAFDNLSGTLGSLTEFVSFSQHPTDVTTLLGGAQDVGSSAVDAGHPGLGTLAWMNVNSGDGGFNAINPSNPLEWFTANTEVSIQRCTQGIHCNASAFPTVVDSTKVGGDRGDFYTPYILDPGMPGRIIVGTCRVWRGNSDGTAWTSANVLTPDLDSGSAGTCTGSESNLVSALAAGGPVGALGNAGSRVIYAGTNSGNVYVVKVGATGQPAWYYRHIAGNKISDIAIDPGDPTGSTAYLTVMGFAVGGHVFKTSDAGLSWQNLSGDLPDAPADSVVLDPNDRSVIYVGTDVGLFVSSDGGQDWTEWGIGLPNVPITRARAFVSADKSVNKLRVSTYGRGLWQTDLLTAMPFRLALASASLSTFPGQDASFAVSLTPQAGFKGTVTVSCDGATVPATCRGGVADLAAGPVQFTVVAADTAVGTYSFGIKAVGSDSGATTFELPATLAVADFGLALVSTSPAPFQVGHSGTGQIGLTLSSLGPFSGVVSLSCPSAPPGITCSFSGAENGVTLAPGDAVPVSATVSADSTVPVGDYTLAISARDAATSHAVHVPLSVVLNPRFLMTPGPSVSVVATTVVHQAVTLSSQDGYAGTVNLTACCGATVTPATVTSFPSTVNVAAPTFLGSSGPLALVVNGVDASDSTQVNSAVAPYTVMDYRVSAPLGLTGPVFFFPGQSGSFVFDLNITGEYGYTGQIALAGCSSTAGISVNCTFDPPGPLTAGPSALPVSVTVNVPAIPSPGDYPLAIHLHDVNVPALDLGSGMIFSVQDFQLVSGSGTSWTTRAGTPVTFPIFGQNAATGTTFSGSVHFDPNTACTGLPQLATCTFSSNEITPTSPPVYLTINTVAPHLGMLSPGRDRGTPFYALVLSFPAWAGIFTLGRDSGRRRTWIGLLALAVLLCIAFGAAGCGAGGANGSAGGGAQATTIAGTPPGTYAVTVTGTSTNAGMTVTHSMQFTLTVQ